MSAIIFGGRRAKPAPLVYEARSWEHGVFIGSIMASETVRIRCARSRQGTVRRVGAAGGGWGGRAAGGAGRGGARRPANTAKTHPG